MDLRQTTPIKMICFTNIKRKRERREEVTQAGMFLDSLLHSDTQRYKHGVD